MRFGVLQNELLLSHGLSEGKTDTREAFAHGGRGAQSWDHDVVHSVRDVEPRANSLQAAQRPGSHDTSDSGSVRAAGNGCAKGTEHVTENPVEGDGARASVQGSQGTTQPEVEAGGFALSEEDAVVDVLVKFLQVPE